MTGKMDLFPKASGWLMSALSILRTKGFDPFGLLRFCNFYMNMEISYAINNFKT